MNVSALAMHLSCLFGSSLWLGGNQSILIGSGDSASDGYRPDLFQDVPDRSHHMLTSRHHVLGVASRSVCRFWSFQIFALSWGSQWRSTTRRSSSFHTFPLETECSSTTTPSATGYCRLGWMWPFPFRRSAVYYLEHQRSHWICFSKQKNREFKLKYFKSGSSMTTTTSYVSRRFTERMSISKLFRCWLRDLGFFVTFFPGNENAGGSAICIHKELLPEDAIVTHMITCQGRDHVVSRQSGR